MQNNIQILSESKSYNQKWYFLSQYKLSNFKINWVEFDFKLEDVETLVKNICLTEETKYQFDWITSLKIRRLWRKQTVNLSIYKKIRSIFPNWK